MKYNIIVSPSGVKFKSDDNLLNDAISQGVPLGHSCKTGACGVCRADVISGSVENEHGEIVSQGQVLTCQSSAHSDLVLKASYYPELIAIKQQMIPCKVTNVERIARDIIILRLRYPPSIKLQYLAGQHIDLIYKGVKRSYSIANALSDEKEIELHIRQVPNGEMSSLLFGDVKNNQLMRIEGPKGTFFVRSSDKPLILLATGTGIAPVKAIVEQLLLSRDLRDVHIYWGMRSADELYCKTLDDISSSNPHISFTQVLSRDDKWSGKRRYIQDVVCERFDSLEKFEVYACGSIDMINSAWEKFKNKRLPSDRFHSDAFTPAKSV